MLHSFSHLVFPLLAQSTAPAANSSLRWIVDGGIILIYMVVMVYIGMYSSRHKGDTRDYFAAGGRIPLWALSMSMLAAIISSVTFLAYPGYAFGGNWILLVQGLMVPVVLLATVWFIVPIFRHSIGISAYEYFERRFSYGSRLYASLAFAVLNLTKTGSVIYLLAIAFNALTGVPMLPIILIVVSVTLVYTLIGGMEAVIWTDVVQGFLLLAGGLLVLAVLLFKPEGGPGHVLATAWNNNKIGLGPYDWNFQIRGFWVLAINGIFYAVQKYSTDQTMIQRYLANNSDRGAIKATLTSGFLCIPTWTMFMLIGSLLWAFYKITKLPLVDAAGHALKSDEVFPHFMTTQLPTGVSGLVLAALLASAMSAISSDLSCLAAVIMEDYYRRLRPDSTDRERLWIGKLAVVASAVAAVLVAILYLVFNKGAILGFVFELYAIFAGGLAGLFALAYLTRRANWQGALIGIGATVLFCAWGFFTSHSKALGRIILDLNKLTGFHHLNFTQDPYMLQVYPHFILFGVGYLASLMFAAPSLDVDRFTIYGYLARRRREKFSESMETTSALESGS
ncbi:MAG: sodium:solute symporter family transporter [Phycisphaerae bacterium]